MTPDGKRPRREHRVPRSEKIAGCKSLGIWPLSQAAEACFGTPRWPTERRVPQVSIGRDHDRRCHPTGSYPCITSTSAACTGCTPPASIKPPGGTGVTRLHPTSRSASPRTFSDDANTITGRGQLSEGGKTWESDLDLNYHRMVRARARRRDRDASLRSATRPASKGHPCGHSGRRCCG